MAEKGATKLVLKPGVIFQFLTNFAPTENRESLQLNTISCVGQDLEQLAKAAEEIKEIVHIDFSLNGLSDVSPLKDLAKLVTLNLANNRIKNVQIFAQEESLPSLKRLDLQNNKFNAFPAFKLPKLEYLNVSGNKLEKVDEGWQGHAEIRTLIAVDNKFKSLAVFKNLPKCEELYLATNNITSFSGWESLPSLKKLHLRRNKIDKVVEEEQPELPELTYLNLRSNQIKDLETSYKVFKLCPKLTDLNILNNPADLNCSSFNLLLAEHLCRSTQLTRFCKTKVTEANLLEAVHLAHYRWDKSEVERKAREAAEKEKEED